MRIERGHALSPRVKRSIARREVCARESSAREALARETALRREAEEKCARLQEAQSLRDSLAQMTVHDLRTPLTSLLTGLQAMEDQGELSPAQRECLSIAIHGGESLMSMINELLDISRGESGALELDCSPVSVSALVEGALRQVAPIAQAKGLQVNAEVESELPSLCGDREKLERALVNLLGNAVKFTPASGSVTLNASFCARSDHKGGHNGACVLSISDTGEGIPEEAFSTIFEKFGQVENRKLGRRASSGLGLTFCKMIAEAHGGRIWVSSALGQGSTFALTIPVQQTDISAQ